MEIENNTLEENKSKSNKKNNIIKIFVDETESLLIKGKLNQYNDNLKINALQKDKSMSEFLRDIILKSLLNLDNNQLNGLEVKVEQLEKYVKRNVSLTFESIKENLGDKKAKDILENAKLDIVNLKDSEEKE